MDSQVGAKGPGAMGRSSFTSGKDVVSPIGTLPSGSFLGISGIGGSLNDVCACANTVPRKVAASMLRMAGRAGWGVVCFFRCVVMIGSKLSYPNSEAMEIEQRRTAVNDAHFQSQWWLRANRTYSSILIRQEPLRLRVADLAASGFQRTAIRGGRCDSGRKYKQYCLGKIVEDFSSHSLSLTRGTSSLKCRRQAPQFEFGLSSPPRMVYSFGKNESVTPSR